jgi:hypothetical protein
VFGEPNKFNAFCLLTNENIEGQFVHPQVQVQVSWFPARLPRSIPTAAHANLQLKVGLFLLVSRNVSESTPLNFAFPHLVSCDNYMLVQLLMHVHVAQASLRMT